MAYLCSMPGVSACQQRTWARRLPAELATVCMLARRGQQAHLWGIKQAAADRP